MKVARYARQSWHEPHQRHETDRWRASLEDVIARRHSLGASADRSLEVRVADVEREMASWTVQDAHGEYVIAV
jgi:hypothetical protein